MSSPDNQVLSSQFTVEQEKTYLKALIAKAQMREEGLVISTGDKGALGHTISLLASRPPGRIGPIVGRFVHRGFLTRLPGKKGSGYLITQVAQDLVNGTIPNSRPAASPRRRRNPVRETKPATSLTTSTSPIDQSLASKLAKVAEMAVVFGSAETEIFQLEVKINELRKIVQDPKYAQASKVMELLQKIDEVETSS